MVTVCKLVKMRYSNVERTIQMKKKKNSKVKIIDSSTTSQKVINICLLGGLVNEKIRVQYQLIRV